MKDTVPDLDPEEPPAEAAVRARGKRRTLRLSSLPILFVAFLLLAGAGGAAAWGQFKPGKTAPMVSIALSAAAVVLTLVALWLRPRDGRHRGR